MTETLGVLKPCSSYISAYGVNNRQKMLLCVKDWEIYSIYQKGSKSSLVQLNSQGGYLLIGVWVLYIDLMTPLFNY